MNPRRRRLLIPGLLAALLLVVLIAALVDRAEAADPARPVVMTDPRITESSGLAVSVEHPKLAYTINDSGSAAEVFAVDLDSGDVVGVTTLTADLRDPEALALRDGVLWIADLGDNQGVRDDTALYAIDEPGPVSGDVDPQRYRVALPDGPADVEALLAEPGADHLEVVTKTVGAATLYRLREADLSPDRVTEFEPVRGGLPALVTDGAWSPDGTRVALLSYGTVWTLDPADWSVLTRQATPTSAQTETLAFVDEGTVLVGSEGVASPLHRVALSEPEPAEAAESPAAEPASAESDDSSRRGLLGAGAIGAGALAGIVVLRGRSRARARSRGTRRAVR